MVDFQFTKVLVRRWKAFVANGSNFGSLWLMVNFFLLQLTEMYRDTHYLKSPSSLRVRRFLFLACLKDARWDDEGRVKTIYWSKGTVVREESVVNLRS